jgi:general secretion pathway protein D
VIHNGQFALDRAEEQFKQAERQKQADEAAKQADARRLDDEKQKQRTVGGLIRTARRLVEEQKYEEALGVIDQILILDSTNDYGVGVRPLVEDKAALQVQRRHRENFDRNMTKQLNAAEERKIPYDDIYRYPSNWPDISELRDQTTREERGLRQEDEAVLAQLEKRLPEVRLDGVPFTDVIDFLRDVTSANIFVNWRALEASQVDKNTPVTALLRDVKFAKALSTILNDVGGATVKLGYTIDEGVITISTIDDLSKNVVTQVYDIRDIIVDIPDFANAPSFNLSSTTSGTGTGTSGGTSSGSSTGLFSNTSSGSGSSGTPGITRADRIAQIITLIQDTVSSETWKDNGGNVGSIKELSGQLIVTQTPESQRQLLNLLAQLREVRAIQVTVETRFLTVQRNFLEDVGMDFDIILNQRGQINKRVSPIVVGQNSFQFTNAPQTVAPGSLGGTVQGMDVTATFLDDVQVNFLLRATQASVTSSVVTAPRVTLFNGQRAWVVVATQTAYVSNLTPVVLTISTGLATNTFTGYQPVVSLANSGVLLDVTATVSADRKYVTLTLLPTLNHLANLVNVPFATGVGTTGTIQLPIMETTSLATTVSVPDGGTLLLGGQTVAGEIEKEVGVPILSKIPFLKRVFTNRSMAKDEQVLLILVKPTIIIQREQEQKQFPLLSSRVGRGVAAP